MLYHEKAMRLSLIHEEDIRQAAKRVVDLSRAHRDRLVGMQDQRVALAHENPYVTVFVELFRYARGLTVDDSQAATQLDVAQSVLGDPLYAGADGNVEAPLLTLVWHGARVRRKLRRGEALTAEEQEFLE